MPTKVRTPTHQRRGPTNTFPSNPPGILPTSTDSRKALRDYQQLAVDLADHHLTGSNPAAYIALGTGGGKTLIGAEIARREIERGGRVLWLVHRDVLVEQAHRTLSSVTVTGLVKGGHCEYGQPITAASVQTLVRANRLRLLQAHGPVTLVLVDEAHRAHTRNSYGRVLERLKPARIVGMTATPFRNGGGFRDLFPVPIFSRTAEELARAGWLVNPRWQAVSIGRLSLAGLRLSGGDYKAADLGAALDGRAEAIAARVAPIIGDRRSIAFAPTVKAAQQLSDAFNRQGIKAAAIWGSQQPAERAAVLSLLRSGDLQLVANCAVLTEGFDLPELEALVIARPTTSPLLYEQMVGRVLRTAPGKTEALILDLAGEDLRQLRFPEIFDSVAADAPNPTGKPALLGRRRGQRLRSTSGLALTVSDGGALICTTTATRDHGRLLVAVVPDRHGSGLYTAHALEFDQTCMLIDDTPLHDSPLLLGDSLKHLRPARNGLSAEHAPWRSRPASPKALAFLGSLDREIAREARRADWTAGEVSQAIDAARFGPAVDRLGL